MADSQPPSEPIGVESLFSIRNKVALVTGGSRGIGLMIARGFVEAGAKVYITSRSADVCDDVAAELSHIGSCIALPMDLSSIAGCEATAAELAGREERLHILVNNAGASWGEPIESFPEEGFDKVMDLNVKSVFFLTRELLPLLEEAGEDADPARVINIGSIQRDRATVSAQLLLRRVEGCGTPPNAYPCRPSGRAPYHGQRHRPRAVREQDDRVAARQPPGRVRGGVPIGTDRIALRCGGGRNLSRVAGRFLRQWRRHSGGRRPGSQMINITSSGFPPSCSPMAALRHGELR